MNYTLHLTENCNLKCKYCYEKNKSNNEISFENIKLLINNEIKENKESCFITFYGGEPLLKKDLIFSTIDYINSKKSKTKFYYAMTTNGTLLDMEFIEYIKKNNFSFIAYSFDGIKKSQNVNRITIDGKGSFDIVEENAKNLLNNFNNVVAMMVITKNNINYLEESINYLINLGFEYFNLQFNYLDDWKDEDLEIIKNCYQKVANIYYNKILKEEDISITIFDEKIKSHIQKDYDCNKNCNLGMKSINVGSDGNFYPCIQFVGNTNYIIGNCKSGIDFEARKNLINKAQKEHETCKKCSINKRCKHTCACQNYLTTKDINKLSPLTCEFERIMIQISDELAEKLYKNNSKLFIQKYYNKNYDLLKQILDKKII